MGKNIETTSLFGGYTGTTRTTTYGFSPSFFQGPAFGYGVYSLGVLVLGFMQGLPVFGLRTTLVLDTCHKKCRNARVWGSCA